MKKAIELASDLAAYGLYGAGNDNTPEQKNWGADRIEAAVILLNASGKKKVNVCGQRLDADTLETLAKGLREEAKTICKKTITRDEIVGEYCDNHDFVILGIGKVNKDGTFWITTDDGREKVTMDILKAEFGIVAYLGNEVYQIRSER